MKNWFTNIPLLVGIVLINVFFTDNVSKYSPQETEVVIVDQSLLNYQTLLKDLPKDITVVLAGNSLIDLKTKLTKYSGLKRIHLLTHGSDGDLILAGIHLQQSNIAQYRDFWQTLKTSTAIDAELLIYSCDLASGKKGQAFVRSLSEHLSMSVAASTDPTGGAKNGGNWSLEYVAGSVDHHGVLAPTFYDGLLIPKFSALLGSSSPLQNFIASGQTELIYGDFDNDGDVDIHSYPGPGNNNDFWQNNGNGTFTKATNLASNPFRDLTNKAAFANKQFTFVADFDNDGDVDVLATLRGGDKNIFYQNNNGTFVEKKGANSPFNGITIAQNTQIIFGDFDNDGDIDLDTWDGDLNHANDFWVNNGSGGFAKLTDNTQNPFRNLGYVGGFYASAAFAHVADWDNDGDDDIYLSKYDNNVLNVFLRNTNGVFAKETGANSPFNAIPQNIAFNQFIYGDFDADGDIDIQATANNSNFFFYRNNGSGTFSSVSGNDNPFDLLTYKSPFYNTATKAFVADWDHDGDDDVFNTQWDNANANVLLIQTGAAAKLTSTSPVKNSGSVSVSANIVLNFDKALNVVAGKNIVIKRANNTTFATIPVNNTQVTGGNSPSITINPTADLDGVTTFYILIDKGAFVDADGRPFAGLSAATDFAFTTAATPVTPTVTTASAATIGTTSAALGGNVTSDGGLSVTDRGIVWGIASGPTIANNKVQNTSGTGAFNATVGSLQEGTRIYVRAYATNAVGTTYGNEVNFYTKTRVVSMARVGTTPTNANTISYDVVFAQSVTGVSTDDFSVTVTGAATATVSAVSGSGTTYTVDIAVSGGNGTVRLDLTNPAGTIPNVNQNYTSAPLYTIYRTTEASNYFRKLTLSGNWNVAATWQSSADQSYWITATSAPTSSAGSVQIAADATVILPSGVNATSGILTNSGQLIINGALSVTGAVTSTGTLAGSGTITSSTTTSSGIIAPGNSPGILSVSGAAASNNIVNIELAGTTPGTGYDQLLVSGALSLSGTLNVTLGAGYTPVLNDEFTVIDAGSISGSFTTVNLPPVAPRVWNTTYNNVTGTLILKVVLDPLPVTLIRFGAEKHEGQILLSWQTTSETNSSHFKIERSDKNLKWVETGDVAAVGESSMLQNYTYTDTQPLSGENLYRLKMVDVDGSFAYSKIVSVHFESKRLSAYPNPVSEKLFIKDGPTVNSVKLYNVNGILVFSAASFPEKGLDVRPLASGMYIVNITDQSGKVETLKFVKE
ncbi:DUF4347 domain-containing protein [Dyadobacter sp. CY312]|uniref:DUF4347 domain-containing protein n=1 Tax=Dyadobacter sp. CY312 TaxID=2907303 RepID=UPI001F35C41C|nr:DUF4347 domain-containing protein [Dyadobacter sp. CY312]MCE7040412.1 DUF4347 domain-containing protein [Dyadobacter sp. CY312]